MILVLTPFFIGIIFSFGSFEKNSITVGLVDQDNTPLTEMLAQSLEETSPVFRLEEGEIRRALARSQADYILVIAPGFSQQLIAGEEPKLQREIKLLSIRDWKNTKGEILFSSPLLFSSKKKA